VLKLFVVGNAMGWDGMGFGDWGQWGGRGECGVSGEKACLYRGEGRGGEEGRLAFPSSLAGCLLGAGCPDGTGRGMAGNSKLDYLKGLFAKWGNFVMAMWGWGLGFAF
jgi:hypothetical protein